MTKKLKILIYKSTESKVSEHKLRVFSDILSEYGFSVEQVVLPSFLSCSKWIDQGVKSFFSLQAMLLRKIIQSDRVVFYQDSGFPHIIMARLFLKKPVSYLAGSPVRIYLSRLIGSNYSLKSKIRRYIEFLTSVLSLKISSQIVAISKSCTLGLNLRKKNTVYPVPDWSIKKVSTQYKFEREYKARSKTILFVGRLEWEKGAHLLVDICNKFRQIDPLYTMLIVGRGTLKDFIEKTTSKDNVKMIGFVENEKLSDIYNDARLTVILSITEGIPAVVFESMLCGTPVLATPVGGIPDIIEDGNTGFLIHDLSPDWIVNRAFQAINGFNDSEEIRKSILASPFMISAEIWTEILS